MLIENVVSSIFFIRYIASLWLVRSISICGILNSSSVGSNRLHYNKLLSDNRIIKYRNYM